MHGKHCLQAERCDFQCMSQVQIPSDSTMYQSQSGNRGEEGAVDQLSLSRVPVAGCIGAFRVLVSTLYM